MNLQKIIRKRIKGSTLVLVLIILFVASLLLFFTLSTLVSQTKQVKVEREKNKADLFAESALDVLTKKFVDNPNDFINNYVSGNSTSVKLDDSANGLNICGSHYSDITKKCSDDSQVVAKKLNYVYGFKLKHDETLQVDLAKRGQTPTVNKVDLEFTMPNLTTKQDRFLITSYYYQGSGSNIKLKVGGSCNVMFNRTNTDVTCLGNIAGAVLGVPSDKQNYGERRVEFTFSGNKPHFIRIKGIYSDTSKFAWISVTGANYSDLPLPQMIILDANVYTYGNNSEQLHSHLVKSIMINPQMPEVFDWVLFNGSNQSIVK